MDPLVVDLNRTGTHGIEVAAPSFHTDGPFEVVLDNHGAALHVFLQVDDDLADAVTLSAGNHFVDQESIRRVDVDVDASAAPVRGHMKVVTGYGAQTEYVTIAVDEPEEERAGVEVDESLGKPRPRPEPSQRRFDLDLVGLPVVVLGGLAVVVALFAAVALDADSALIVVLFVLVAVGVGVVLLRG